MKSRSFLAATLMIFVLTSLVYGEISLTANGQDTDSYYVEPGDTIDIGVYADNESFLDVFISIADDPVSLASASWTDNYNTYSPPASRTVEPQHSWTCP